MKNCPELFPHSLKKSGPCAACVKTNPPEKKKLAATIGDFLKTVIDFIVLKISG